MSLLTLTETELIQRLGDALEEIEWAATTWTDYATCPFCGAIGDDKEPHTADCRWVELMRLLGRR